MIKTLRRCGLTFAVTLLLGAVGAVAFQRPAAANGETFKWKDYNTITVSGGDLKGTGELKLQPGGAGGIIGPGYTGPTDIDGVFVGSLTMRESGKDCLVGVRVLTFRSSGNSSGLLWNPPPYGPSAGSPGGPGQCSESLQRAMHNKNVSIGGTRPTDPNNSSETPEQQTIRVYVDAPDPLSTAPKEDTITIKKLDGTVIASQTIPLVDDSGAADWPPDQTPVAGNTIFQNIAPDTDYLVCDTYVAKECKQVHKKKGESLSVSLGTRFQTPNQKRVHVHVEYEASRPSGSSLSVSPLMVELKGPDGKFYEQQTKPGVSDPNPEEGNTSCEVKVTLGFEVFFDNMTLPGNYEACATGAECQSGLKVDGEELNITITIKTEEEGPPDQKVCTSGDGVAGALAWIICPATQLIASATDFFENNIIVPFLTISPLTTSGDNPIYILWQNFRDLANVGFVVLLFISIFSIALSKYGLKRVLPRLLIVVIGINLSYFFVAFVIDAFNIFGAGISQFVMASLQQAGTTQLNTGTEAGAVRSIFTLGGAALLTIILTGGAALGWLFSFLGLAALVVVITVIVLVVRQMAIIVLVALAPVAILLYLLPNTEGYTKKWWKTLTKLLAMYPLIVLLFASGKIFGFILQQPDFKIAGDGISDEVAQAVRVILQFLVYVIPLLFLPATFAASGALMSKIFSLLNNSRLRQAVQKPGESFSENVVKPARQEIVVHAARRGGRIGQLAGYEMRSNFKKEQREHELKHAQQQYVSDQALNDSFAASAAGIGGQQGVTRVQGAAVSVLEKARKQAEANEMAIFSNELRQLGLSTKEFNNSFSDYLKDPTKNIVTGKMRDPQGNVRTIDLAQRQDLTRSALNSAASAGEITTVEQARMSTGINQDMLDEVIRNNEGTLKSKGGYHLATNFNLAEGRSQGTQRDMHLARIKQNLAQTDGASIAGMKASFLGDVRRMLQDPATHRSLTTGPDAITAQERQQVRDNIQQIWNSPDLAGSAKNPQALRDIQRLI
jgi:hypothetical protein